MKHLFLALALCLSSVSAFAEAGNDGPNAAPREAKQSIEYLAEVTVASGFVPPSAPIGETVGVKASGEVILTKVYSNGKAATKEVIAKLSKSTIAKLVSNIKNVSQGEMVSTNPEMPICEDAPTTTYIAKGLIVRQVAGCKTYSRLGANYADEQVVRTLDALMDIANLRKFN